MQINVKPRKIIFFLLFSLCKFLIFYSFVHYKNARGAAVGDAARISNGQPAKDGEFPFVASIFIFNSHTCGSTILNEEWVLTAAKCVYKYNTEDYEVRVGSTNWPSGRVHRAQERHTHPAYVNSAADNWPHNVALLKVSPPFEFDDLVQPVVLAEYGSDVETGAVGLTAGWGTTFSGRLLEDDLLKAEVMTLANDECLSQVPGISTNLTLCAGGANAGICVGDEGGPLLIDEVQVGIVSWQPGTCGEKPGVFTRVSQYYDWIAAKLQNFPMDLLK